MKKFSRILFLAITVWALWVFLIPEYAQAQVYYWVGESGSWDDPNNWSHTEGGPGGAGPPVFDNLYLIQSDDVDRTVYFTGFASGGGEMTIDSTGTGTMSLVITDGRLGTDVGGIIIRNSIVNQSGGSMRDDLYGIFIENAEYNINGGSLTTGDSGIYISNSTINQTGGFVYDGYEGVHISDSIYNLSEGKLESGAGIDIGGTFNLSGGSVFVDHSNNYGGLQIGGTFNQSGGAVSVDYIGLGIGGNATYNLSGGSVAVSGYWSSFENAGQFNYSGGSLSASGQYENKDIINNGTMTLSGSGTRVMEGTVANYGLFETTETTAEFTDTFTNYLDFTSYSSRNYFTELIIGADGTMDGRADDRWYVSDALLGIDIQDGTVTNIYGYPGMKVYYSASVPENSYLRGLTYDLTGGGQLLPIPEPNTGSMGTEVTFRGTGFGDKKGKVYIGSKACRVLEWSDISIRCVLGNNFRLMEPGIYDVTVEPKEPKWAEPIVMEDAFTITAD